MRGVKVVWGSMQNDQCCAIFVAKTNRPININIFQSDLIEIFMLIGWFVLATKLEQVYD